MAYTKQTWANGPDGNTPLSASRLNHIEDGIEEVSEALEEAIVEGGVPIIQKDGEGWPAERPEVNGQVMFSNTIDDDDTLPEWAVVGDIYVRRVDI